jgi:hypothetical protein
MLLPDHAADHGVGRERTTTSVTRGPADRDSCHQRSSGRSICHCVGESSDDTGALAPLRVSSPYVIIIDRPSAEDGHPVTHAHADERCDERTLKLSSTSVGPEGDFLDENPKTVDGENELHVEDV